jgi:5-methyltetrahydrofolate--homocysteine methyltransferase
MTRFDPRARLEQFPILRTLKDRVLVFDGGMGTQLQLANLTLDDFRGLEGCNELLVETRPDVVQAIHERYFEAGADMVETNTFGGSPITLAEFDLQAEAHDLNRASAILAREAADQFKDGRPRFVIGSVGPGTKLPSLGHIDYQTLEDALAVQCAGLLDGGIDAFLIETCQDPLHYKAAINGAKRARLAAKSAAPILLQVTVETTGTLLVGTDIAAAATVGHALNAAAMGLNCATGPREMAEHVRWLAENWEGPITVQPNAGLPELVDGKTRYPLTPEEMTKWLERFVVEDGVNLIGGCCGTTPDHIRALDAMLRQRSSDGWRPAPDQSGRPHGCRRSRRSMARCRCARRTPICRSASAATPMAARSFANCRKRATGRAASTWDASRCARDRTRWTSAPPSSAATRSRRWPRSCRACAARSTRRW